MTEQTSFQIKFMLSNDDFLPVQTRVSSRAKHQGIRLTRFGILEVVIPVKNSSKGSRRHKNGLEVLKGNVAAGTDTHQILLFLEEHRSWIERAYRRQLPLITAYRQSEQVGLPSEMSFACLREHWKIEYVQTKARCLTVRAKQELPMLSKYSASSESSASSVPLAPPMLSLAFVQEENFQDSILGEAQQTKQSLPKGDLCDVSCNVPLDMPLSMPLGASLDTPQEGACILRGTLRISGNIVDSQSAKKALKRFMARRAAECLPRYAWNIIQEVQTQTQAITRIPASIKIVDRKTTWGTCTRDGVIKLDRKLLFLPEVLARQIVLHEFSHLKELNHSQRFYNLLYSLPNSNAIYEKQTKKASIHIPAWYYSTTVL